jgi:hypothetical protein
MVWMYVLLFSEKSWISSLKQSDEEFNGWLMNIFGPFYLFFVSYVSGVAPASAKVWKTNFWRHLNQGCLTYKAKICLRSTRSLNIFTQYLSEVRHIFTRYHIKNRYWILTSEKNRLLTEKPPEISLRTSRQWRNCGYGYSQWSFAVDASILDYIFWERLFITIPLKIRCHLSSTR